jgi:voltage-gated potassium channel
MVVAVLFIPVLVVPLAVHLSSGVTAAFDAADYTIWALFAGEFIAKLCLAQHRAYFIRTHIPDLIVVAVPLLRPLRIIRSVRLLRALRGMRALSFSLVAFRELRRILAHRKFHFVLLTVLVLVFLAASFELEFERHATGSGAIHNYPDALWWAVVTITTVGYGDRVPVTAAGRGVAVLLMVSGIALFGALTATLASYFAQEDADAAHVQLTEVNARLGRIESALLSIATDAASQRQVLSETS